MADITIRTVTFPNAMVGVPYEAAIAYQGNATALTASAVASGALPPGLVLDVALPFTRIVGIPTTDGLFTFTVSLTDTAGAVTSGPLTIRVTTLNLDEGDNVSAQADIRIEWPLSGT